MKPTKTRNLLIYRATYTTKSKQLGANLSKELQKRYGKRSARVQKGDVVKIVRGEFEGVGGKVSKVSTQKSSVAIEGIKREQTRGEKYDVYIHASNLVITSLNTDDKWRIAKLEDKDPREMPDTEPGEKETTNKDGTAKETDAPGNEEREEGIAEETGDAEPGTVEEKAQRDGTAKETDAPGNEGQSDDTPKETKKAKDPKEDEG